MVAIAVPRAAPADLLELTKPRIVLMVLITVAVGFYMADPQTALSPALRILLLAHTLIGTTLVAAGTNALNQILERDADALMRRTANRPLPAGRLTAVEASVFAWSSALLGIAYLAAFVNAATTILAAATLASYVFVYTPLKRRTTLATLIGAVPGALPIVGGWTAAGAAIDVRALSLFWILFLWQIPHFLALAWLYREDYARAGMKMLSVVDERGKMTFRQAALNACALVPISLVPAVLGMTGAPYFFGAMLLSSWFLWVSISAARHHSLQGARRLFLASLVYLPVLLTLMVADRII
ncbi:MAG: heme o synthase [Gemmatimonadaceae bacterium]